MTVAKIAHSNLTETMLDENNAIGGLFKPGKDIEISNLWTLQCSIRRCKCNLLIKFDCKIVPMQILLRGIETFTACPSAGDRALCCGVANAFRS